jgi:hypothetical protein
VDGLKNSNRSEDKVLGKSVGVLAREAIRWAQESLRTSNGSVMGQKKTGNFDEAGDDAILSCCMYVSLSTF